MSRYTRGGDAAQHTYHSSAWDPSPYGITGYDDVHQFTSSQAAPANQLNSAGAGAGANSNAYRLAPPATNIGADSPSMYTDPYEAFSAAPPPDQPHTAAANATRQSELEHDSHLSSHDDHALHVTPTLLERSDTLAPHDSISSYNVRIGRNVEADQPPTAAYAAPRSAVPSHALQASLSYINHYDDPNSTEYYDGAHHHLDQDDYAHHSRYDTSGVDLPLKSHANPMGYAEDEDDEAAQIKRGDTSALWTNQMNDPSHHDQYHSSRGAGGDEEAKSGLLGTLSRSAKSQRLVGQDKVRDEIERRRQGIGRQRYPIVTWIVGVALVVVFMVELIKANAETGQAIQTRPTSLLEKFYEQFQRLYFK
uniref:Uncharacterized protein n=1 Tax=Melanopsichium pennsylvanicum 4 TaxID=1398559 RepID=A0A077R0V0_9BASI|nr:conserved hypothetical protein [Melanopsichium pennsylvanicum 4]